MLHFTISIQGLNEAEALVGKVKKAVSELDSWLTDVGGYLKDFFENSVFESEGSVYGNVWSSLSPSYMAEKSVLYPGRGILEASGNMRHSFEAMSGSDFLTITNTSPLALYHQTGTYKMPQRIIMQLDDTRISKIVDMLKDHIQSYF